MKNADKTYLESLKAPSSEVEEEVVELTQTESPTYRGRKRRSVACGDVIGRKSPSGRGSAHAEFAKFPDRRESLTYSSREASFGWIDNSFLEN
ncbi:UNVERIFIED_CONTAM: hypothetical protein PYX00_009255 [Menopon gallinae]|uniref:Uncharacterized protein n=1 Tax=Menopon gallinae TaxID=328185 RepID=A0AAW2HAU9_9NEOP